MNDWPQSLSRRRAIEGLATFLAGSPLLAAQLDPHPLKDHTRVRGLEEMLTAFDFEPVLFANVPLAVFDHTAHGDGSEFTLRRNRDAFDWVDIVGGPAVDVKSVNTSTEVLGIKMDSPIVVSPSAAQRELHPDGELEMHRGATAAKTTMIISNAASFPVDKITAAATGPTWAQFFPRTDLNASREELEKVQAAGCRAVVVTVDVQVAYDERALHDRNLGGTPRHVEPRRPAARNPYRVPENRLWYTWQYMEAIHKFLNVPMLVKGILTAEDAQLCLDHGVDGIIVSNHGGRSLDYCQSTIEVLPEIAAVVQGRLPVLVDSGFRRGTDVFKAIALGANAVCLGRAARWGLGAFGARGVQRVLEIIQQELVQAMAHAGRSTPTSLDRTAVRTHFS